LIKVFKNLSNEKFVEVIKIFPDLSQGDVNTNSDGEERQPLLFNAVTNSLQRASSDTTSENQTHYCWRWYVLAVVAILNLSNGMVSLVFYLIPVCLC